MVVALKKITGPTHMAEDGHHLKNMANLRDLIAATGLAILLKLIQIINFSACVTLKFDGWPR